jgi:hypothetical protein
MSDILPLLLDKKPVSEKLLGYWYCALHSGILCMGTEFVFTRVLPAWRTLGKTVRNRPMLYEHRSAYPELAAWLESAAPAADLPYSAVFLTTEDNLRCVVLFDRDERRAETLNSIRDLVPPPLCDEISEAVLWIGRLLMSKLFIYWSVTPKPLDEPAICTTSAMYYAYLRLRAGKLREAAGKDLYTEGTLEFLKELQKAVVARPDS